VTPPTTLRVNGGSHTVAVDDNTPLIFILRNDLQLKGTRHGCGQGLCGSCSVLLNGRSVQSCTTPLSAAAGGEITTIEGLASSGALHPLQQAFIDEQAGQCGYCLSGIIMGAAALLHTNPAPTDADIRTALDGHLCRCGSHERIVRAIQNAAKAMSKSRTA
jgi:nicotinate dehydrogenase subunit A